MGDARHDPKRQNVLGVGVSVIDMGAAVRTIQNWIDGRMQRYVCVTSVHGVMASQASAELRHIHNEAGMVTPDGMPLAWLLRLAGHTHTSRVCGPELMPAVFAASQSRRDRHFLYGATEQTLAKLRTGLLAQAPAALIVGCYAPPFRPLTPAEDVEITALINAAAPDVVWVGLSTPKQERWMAEHRASLTAPVLIGVGAAFDVHAGLSQRAPALMQRFGLEWLYRVAKEPRRLWWRYFWNNPRFLALLALQKTGLYRRELI
ncbi:MAG: WecB/TagA/CpsF family glycosyltransferase [Pseudomonadota bacterium]|nr:WecB/TagA/CpsF family glycosyltransferase [Pseudomonadota bacterium]